MSASGWRVNNGNMFATAELRTQVYFSRSGSEWNWLEPDLEGGLVLIKGRSENSVLVVRGSGFGQLAVKADEIEVAILIPAEMMGGLQSWILDLPHGGVEFDQPEILDRVKRIAAEARSEAVGAEVACEAFVKLLVVDLCRHQHVFMPRRRWVSIPPRKLRKILTYIDENLAGSLCLDEIAAQQGLSPYYFCRIFKKTTGVTLHQFVLRRRVERAKSLLVDERLDLAEVALEAGFANQSHFGAIFRRFTGYTPRQYRQVAA
jgi:AraC-like DNA-binding protein